MVRLIILLCALWAPHSFATTQVTASVDKNPVLENESMVLTVTANDSVETDALDLSALRANFTVGRTSVSSQTRMENFKTSKLTSWTTVIVPRKAGQFTIPSFTIDGVSSRPIVVDVRKLTAGAVDNRDVFITNELSNDSIYVQQQVTLTVRLHFASELKRGALTEPELTNGDANIQQIGKDSETAEIINGKRYRVIERIYTISPQTSGEYLLNTPVFDGEVLEGGRRSVFASFGRTKPVHVNGEQLTISVKPIPSAYTGLWLPSELVTLTDEWSDAETAEYQVGKPITRTLTLTAANLSQEQLPELSLDTASEMAEIKIYPDQTNLHTSTIKGTLVAQAVRSFAIVAKKPGEYSFPEVKIPWWNIKTNQIQYATLPARKVTVVPSPEFAQQQSDIQQILQDRPAASAGTTNQGDIPSTNNNWLQWFFLSGWLLTAGLWGLTSFRKPKKQPLVAQKAMKSSNIDKSIVAACKTNQGMLVLDLLIPWSQSQHPDLKITRLSDVKQALMSSELVQEIDALQNALYSQSPSNWQGDTLAKHLQNYQQQGAIGSAPQFELNPA